MAIAPTGSTDYSPLAQADQPERLGEAELQTKWDRTAVLLIQRIGITLSPFRLEAETRAELNPQLLVGHTYSFGSVSKSDGTPYCVFAYDCQQILAKVPRSPPEMSNQEKSDVAELASVVSGVIEKGRYLKETIEGSIASPALLKAEGVDKMEDSLLLQQFALQSIRGEYLSHPEHAQTSKPCCVLL